MPNRPRDGYPTSFGNVRASVFPHNGPASYTQYTAPTTGGDTVLSGPEAGVTTIDQMIGGISDSGTYRAEVVQITGANSVARAKALLKWYVVASGAEVAALTNLSAETVLLTVLGPK